jgi:hypothetical protein
MIFGVPPRSRPLIRLSGIGPAHYPGLAMIPRAVHEAGSERIVGFMGRDQTEQNAFPAITWQGTIMAPGLCGALRSGALKGRPGGASP